MDIKNRIERVSNALLCMQRNSWEQGVAAQAFIELGKKDFVILMAREAIIRQLKDGRLGVMGNATAATDPAANGESVLYAYKITKDIDFKKAFQMMVDWILSKTPRSKDDIIYHFTDKSQIWVDSLYMAPPCLSIAGYYDEAIKQIDGYRKKLYDNEKKLYSHIWDDDLNDYIRKDFWGVGNGWALAGITRVIKHLPIEMDDEKKKLVGYVREHVEGCIEYLREDGLFHDIIDDSTSFIETNLSQMLAYTIFRGIKAEWLSINYLKYAEKMREAAIKKVDSFGFVQGVCASPSFDYPGTATEGQAFFLLMEAAAQNFYDLK